MYTLGNVLETPLDAHPPFHEEKLEELLLMIIGPLSNLIMVD